MQRIVLSEIKEGQSHGQETEGEENQEAKNETEKA
jgi:hypothetical protein